MQRGRGIFVGLLLILAALVAGAAVSGTLLLGQALRPIRPAPPTPNTPTPARSSPATPCTVPPMAPSNLARIVAAEKVPLYPNARQAEFLSDSKIPIAGTGAQPISETTSLTPDSEDVVQRYYEQALLPLSWTLDAPHDRVLTFRWTDPMHEIPWQLRLYVAYDLALGGNRVTVVLRGAPDILTIPLYPGAQQVTVATYAAGSAGGINCVTQYQVPVSPEEVRAYYQQNLTHYGWAAITVGKNSPPNSFHLGTKPPERLGDLHFSTYVHPACTICVGEGRVDISVTPSAAGGTAITLHTSGFNDELICSCSDALDANPNP
jgi:hypothetical protein